jgi:membrane fusion protein (multidrug efflux system)
VSAVYAADNQVVAAGDVLVRIDARDYETAVARARAEVADAEAAALAAHAAAAMTATTTEAGVAAARGEIGTAQARVSTARARVEEAQAEEARASRDLERMRALVEKDEVSRQEYDQALAAAAAARARREAAESAVRESAKGVDTAGASLQRARAGPDEVRVARAQASAADARVQRARAALAQAQLDHEYTELKAPVSGVVSHRSAEVGQVVQPGQPLLAIVPLEDIWVTANFKETQLAKVRAGQSVRIAVDAYGGREYRGRVDSIAAATGARFSLLPAENASGNFVKVVQRVPVKIVFDKGQDAEHLLRPGMSVKPTILVRGR